MNIEAIKEMLEVAKGLGKALAMEVKSIEVVENEICSQLIMEVVFTDHMPVENTITFFVDDKLQVERRDK